jgi:hypothetical protein
MNWSTEYRADILIWAADILGAIEGRCGRLALAGQVSVEEAGRLTPRQRFLSDMRTLVPDMAPRLFDIPLAGASQGVVIAGQMGT